MKVHIIIFFIFFLSTRSSELVAQKKDNIPIDPLDTLGYNLPEELIIGNNIYKTKYHYLVIGLGFSGNGIKKYDSNIGIDYHLNIKNRYYQIGVMRTKELKGLFPANYIRVFNDFHFSMGKKIENVKMAYFGYAGPSIIYGKNHYSEEAYVTIGVQGQLQCIYKHFFDVGMGLTLYGNINFRYSSAGIRLNIFFSNAFKRKVNAYLK